MPASVTDYPLTSTLVQAPLVRIDVEPSPRNGIRKPSQLIIGKLLSVPIQAVGAVVGQVAKLLLDGLANLVDAWLLLFGNS